MANSNYIGTSINESAVIVDKSAAEVADIRGLCVKFDTNGYLAVADTAGEVVVGFALLTTGDDYTGKVAKEQDIDVQIKDIGRAKAGGDIKKGDLVGTDATGKLVKVTEGFALGMALTNAKADGVVEIAITRQTVTAPSA